MYQETKALSNTFMANVFSWMFAAMGLTALAAYLFGTSDELFSLIYGINEKGVMSMTMLGWIVTFAPFIIVLGMSFSGSKLSTRSTILLYLLYSTLMGMSLSSIFYVYTSASIVKTFVITAGMFGIMAIMGYTTKTDLTKLGSILLMALFGMIIAVLVNFFTHSARLEYIISVVGVIVFTGLTAYDVQKIKNIGQMGIDENDTMVKITIFAALSLYLDFLNLFLYLLRFFGRRD
ncbi:MAG: Bax inhibitor-1/YccA family protein [Bacteroidales bacterium]|nr:Bax inhibitor-1/YccA family protein [Bacteroidales bacterium]